MQLSNSHSYENTDIMFGEFKKVFEIVKTRSRALEILADIDEAALDFETTQLFPNGADGFIRITSITNDDYCVLFDHMFIGEFDDYIEHMLTQRWWVYNAKFEIRWMDFYCEQNRNDDEQLPLADVHDVDFLAKCHLGGGPSSLKIMCARDLKCIIDKSEQMSNWAAPALTESQYNYAGFDAFLTWELFKHWNGILDDAKFTAHNVMNDAVRGTIECEQVGLYLDEEAHLENIRLWTIKRDTFERYCRRYTPPSVIANLGSSQQLGKFLEKELHKSLLDVWPRTKKTKVLQIENDYLKSVARRLPYPMSRWMAALAGMRYYNKYLSTYGDTLITKNQLAGRITSRFNIGMARTIRYSSSDSNLQNIPRKVVVRRAFCSPRGGKQIMCLADYKGVEVRTLAELSGDENLLHDAIYGDVHAASASQIYGHELDWVMEALASEGAGEFSNVYTMLKAQRSTAKAFTFKLTYGAGPDSLSDVLKCTYDGAVEAINKWAERYSNAFGYRNTMHDAMIASGGFIPVTGGTTIYVPKWDQSMPVAANYPIQSAAAKVMYRAVYHVHRLFRERDIPAYMAATVHDEILTYSDVDYADEAMEAQVEGMRLGWLDVFPGSNTDNLVDFAIGHTWAAKP